MKQKALRLTDSNSLKAFLYGIFANRTIEISNFRIPSIQSQFQCVVLFGERVPYDVINNVLDRDAIIKTDYADNDLFITIFELFDVRVIGSGCTIEFEQSMHYNLFNISIKYYKNSDSSRSELTYEVSSIRPQFIANDITITSINLIPNEESMHYTQIGISEYDFKVFANLSSTMFISGTFEFIPKENS